MQRFGEKLRALRKRDKISQRKLAPILGIKSNSFISEIETGKKKPSLEFVLKIAELFDVSVAKLVKDDLELD